MLRLRVFSASVRSCLVISAAGTKKKVLPRKLSNFMINFSHFMNTVLSICTSKREIEDVMAPMSRFYACSLFFCQNIKGYAFSEGVVDYCKMYSKYCIGELCSVCLGAFDDIKG
jgi:hypothetical protein